MPKYTDQSEQESINIMAGNGQHQYSVQEALAIYAGVDPYKMSPVEILNYRNGTTFNMLQEALYSNLSTTLGLAANSQHQYSPQEMLYKAQQAGLSLNEVVNSYLLYDKFTTTVAAGSVNNTSAEPTGGVRTVTDTNSKISIASGLLSFATGEAANSGIWYPTQARKAGRTLLSLVNTTGAASVTFGWTVAANTTTQETIRLAASNALHQVSDATVITIGTYTNNTDYQLCTILRAAGTFFFIKGGTEFPNWTLVWLSGNRNSSMFPGTHSPGTTTIFTVDNIRIPVATFIPQPLLYDTFTRSNGAIGSTESTGPDSQSLTPLVWSGSTWTVASNVAVNSGINYGSELTTNGAFTTDTTGWTASGSSLSSIAGGSSGNCLQVQNTGAAAGYAFQTITTVIGQYYKAVVFFKNGTGALGGVLNIGTTQGGSQLIQKGVVSASFTSRTAFFQATATTTYINLANTSAVSGDNTLFDELSVTPVTSSELFASLATSTKDVIIETVVPNNSIRGGIVLNLDSASNPQNYVVAYVDQLNSATASLFKVVAGVPASVIAAAVTFSATGALRVIKDGTSYQLFYNNLKVGSTSTISDAGIINNTIHGLFSPSNGQQLDLFQLFPRGTAAEYSALDQF
jgi:hypothetical protein